MRKSFFRRIEFLLQLPPLQLTTIKIKYSFLFMVQGANKTSTAQGNIFKLTQNRKLLQWLHILQQQGAQQRATSSSLKLKMILNISFFVLTNELEPSEPFVACLPGISALLVRPGLWCLKLN